MAYTSCCFFTANGGLFLRPPAGFCPVVAVVVMQRLALEVKVASRRKTRFPIGVTINSNKAKPTTAAMAFCVYIHPLQK